MFLLCPLLCPSVITPSPSSPCLQSQRCPRLVSALRDVWVCFLSPTHASTPCHPPATPSLLLTPQRCPRLVSALRDVWVCTLSCGCYHNLALASNGQVYSWGSGARPLEQRRRQVSCFPFCFYFRALREMCCFVFVFFLRMLPQPCARQQRPGQFLRLRSATPRTAAARGELLSFSCILVFLFHSWASEAAAGGALSSFSCCRAFLGFGRPCSRTVAARGAFLSFLLFLLEGCARWGLFCSSCCRAILGKGGARPLETVAARKVFFMIFSSLPQLGPQASSLIRAIASPSIDPASPIHT